MFLNDDSSLRNIDYFYSLVFVLSVLSTYFASHTFLAEFGLEITVVLIFTYFILRLIGPKRGNQNGLLDPRLTDMFFSTLIITNVVFVTGGYASPFYFLLFFLMFAVSMLFGPLVSVPASVILVVVLIADLSVKANMEVLLPILSLLLTVPFSIALGREYHKRMKAREERQSFIGKSKEQFATIIRNHTSSLSKKVDNFQGDHDLESMKKIIRRVHEVIDHYEKHN